MSTKNFNQSECLKTAYGKFMLKFYFVRKDGGHLPKKTIFSYSRNYAFYTPVKMHNSASFLSKYLLTFNNVKAVKALSICELYCVVFSENITPTDTLAIKLIICFNILLKRSTPTVPTILYLISLKSIRY